MHAGNHQHREGPFVVKVEGLGVGLPSRPASMCRISARGQTMQRGSGNSTGDLTWRRGTDMLHLGS